MTEQVKQILQKKHKKKTTWNSTSHASICMNKNSDQNSMDNMLSYICPCEYIVRKVINNSADNAIYSSVLYIAVKIFTQSVKHSKRLKTKF